jgi:predicted metal-binding membrane protein
MTVHRDLQDGARAMMSDWERRGDRVAVLVALAGTIVLAWVYLLRGAGLEMRTISAGGNQMMPMIVPGPPRHPRKFSRCD